MSMLPLMIPHALAITILACRRVTNVQQRSFATPAGSAVDAEVLGRPGLTIPSSVTFFRQPVPRTGPRPSVMEVVVGVS